MKRKCVSVLLTAVCFVLFILPVCAANSATQLSHTVPVTYRVHFILEGGGSVKISGNGLSDTVIKKSGDITVQENQILSVAFSPDGEYYLKSVLYNEADIIPSVKDNVLLSPSVTGDAVVKVIFGKMSTVPTQPETIISNTNNAPYNTGSGGKPTTGDSNFAVISSVLLLFASAAVILLCKRRRIAGKADK